MKREDIELNCIKRYEEAFGRSKSYSFKNKVLTVSFIKQEVPIVLDYGGEYDWTASVFEANEDGSVENFSAFSSGPEYDADEKTAWSLARNVIANLIEDEE